MTALVARFAPWVVLVLTLLGVASWWGERREAQGYARANAENAAVAMEASASNRAKAAELLTQMEQAVNDAKKRETTLAADAVRARAESERLRDDLAASRNQLSTAAADAVRKYAATLGDVFGECGTAIEKLAREAGGHASDSLMYQNGWPKQGAETTRKNKP